MQREKKVVRYSCSKTDSVGCSRAQKITLRSVPDSFKRSQRPEGFKKFEKAWQKNLSCFSDDAKYNEPSENNIDEKIRSQDETSKYVLVDDEDLRTYKASRKRREVKKLEPYNKLITPEELRIQLKRPHFKILQAKKLEGRELISFLNAVPCDKMKPEAAKVTLSPQIGKKSISVYKPEIEIRENIIKPVPKKAKKRKTKIMKAEEIINYEEESTTAPTDEFTTINEEMSEENSKYGSEYTVMTALINSPPDIFQQIISKQMFGDKLSKRSDVGSAQANTPKKQQKPKNYISTSAMQMISDLVSSADIADCFCSLDDHYLASIFLARTGQSLTDPYFMIILDTMLRNYPNLLAQLLTVYGDHNNIILNENFPKFREKSIEHFLSIESLNTKYI